MIFVTRMASKSRPGHRYHEIIWAYRVGGRCLHCYFVVLRTWYPPLGVFLLPLRPQLRPRLSSDVALGVRMQEEEEGVCKEEAEGVSREGDSEKGRRGEMQR